ncbi:MAG: heme lyase CcmF/NrfE family subunit [Deltaproteobacteria bacterium]|nr:heme lyase CcmF/NrfE family subunit [Deltaproteobacteria bacterium]
MSWQIFLPQIGEFCLSLGLAVSVYALFAAVFGDKMNRAKLVLSSERSLYIATVLISIAVFILVFSFLTDNFWIRYVYGYSNRAMPTIYKITALWGGQDGSLLFWLWLTALFGSIAVFTHRDSDRPLLPYVIATFAVILSFFSVLLIYSDNPFKLFPEAPFDGRGLNPLLQNPSMAIHPPALYLGYVGMTVPFAFAMAALITNRLDSRWIQATRLWLLIAWFFLSVGNLLGAQWAYTVLGWGGFWGWDPVENAAIMPWFTASAFLHSVMIQEKRGMLKFWNITLIVISFCLTILGTYLTRSGVVQSVHSFARSSIGYYFLGFLIFTIIFCSYWIWKRRNELRSPTIFESFFSKESAFVLNNIVLVGTAFLILWCTMFPTLSELVIGTRIIVGPPFFNKMIAPGALFLLVLTGIGPVIGWRKASKENMKSSFTWPIIIGLSCTGGAALLHIYHWYVLITIFGATFVLTTLVMEFHKGTVARMITEKEPWWLALTHAVLKNNRKYGGYIVHIGMVFIFMGVAGTAYKQIFEFSLKPEEVAHFNEYTIQFRGLESYDTPNQEEMYAIVDLYRGSEKVGTVKPARFYYKNPDQPSTIVDIFSQFKEDVYFTLGAVEPQTQKTHIQVTLNPVISFLWSGGLILVIGGLIAMLPPMNLRKKPKAKT